jgi:hypothetical protein
VSRPIASHDCLDLKVRLSAYLDGELADDDRLCVDRHLLECRACRDLLERAEALDAEVGTLAVDESAPAPALPSAFADEVLSRIRGGRGSLRAARRAWFLRSYGQSLGLLAAAASIAVVASIAFVRLAYEPQRAAEPTETRSLVSDDAIFESLADGVYGPPRPRYAIAQLRSAPALSRDEAQALLSAAQILRAVAETPFEEVLVRERLRQAARYDELLERLGEIEPKLDPFDRRTVAAAKMILLQLQRDECEFAGWTLLREDLRQVDVPTELDAMASRSASENAA